MTEETRSQNGGPEAGLQKNVRVVTGGSVWIGFLLVVLGLVVLASNFGFLHLSLEKVFFTFWPVFLIFVGLFLLDRKTKGGKIFWIFSLIVILSCLLYFVFGFKSSDDKVWLCHKDAFGRQDDVFCNRHNKFISR